MKTKSPTGTRHLRTYAELTGYLRNFVSGVYPFVWVKGRPGVGKSEAIKAAIRGHRGALYLKGGQVTPLAFYTECYAHRGEPVILDDAEHLLDDKIGARLVSALGDSSPGKLLSYSTSSPCLGDVPPRFYTVSPLAVVANATTRAPALQSRATLLLFDPTSDEVYRAAAGWFWDQEVFGWFGQHLHRLKPLDFRWLGRADADKRVGRDWRRLALDGYGLDPLSCIVQDVEADAAYTTRDSKVDRFLELTRGMRGSSRANYYRRRQQLETEGRLIVQAVPVIPLKRTKRPMPPTQSELDALLTAAPPAEPAEETAPPDLPAREQFEQRPVRGDVPRDTTPRPIILDDLLPGERPPERDDDGEDDD
jgi:hypothetical protein